MGLGERRVDLSAFLGREVFVPGRALIRDLGASYGRREGFPE